MTISPTWPPQGSGAHGLSISSISRGFIWHRRRYWNSTSSHNGPRGYQRSMMKLGRFGLSSIAHMSTSSGCCLCEQVTGASASSSSRWGQVLPFYIKTMEDVRSSVGSELLVECCIKVNCALSHISSCEVLVRTTGGQSTCISSTYTWTSDSLLNSAHSVNYASVWKKFQYRSNRFDSNMCVMNRFNLVPGRSRWQSS